jgi:aryl-alcohol dehydrogenase-like predicted oxidoreductase
LTGRIRTVADLEPGDFRRTSPRFQGENFQKNLALVDRVTALAREKGCTPAQLALAWLLAQGGQIVPIPGTKTCQRLEENAGAVQVRLSAEELRALDRVAPRGVAAGERYAAEGMKTVNR